MALDFPRFPDLIKPSRERKERTPFTDNITFYCGKMVIKAQCLFLHQENKNHVEIAGTYFNFENQNQYLPQIVDIYNQILNTFFLFSVAGVAVNVSELNFA